MASLGRDTDHRQSQDIRQTINQPSLSSSARGLKTGKDTMFCITKERTDTKAQ